MSKCKNELEFHLVSKNEMVPQMAGAVLLCGQDAVLLNTRRMLLTRAGFITSICSENDIASMPQDPAIVLAVMGHSMPHDEQIKTAELVRAKWPDARILFLTRADESLTEISQNEYQSGSVNPSHLIHACRTILNGSVKTIPPASS
jgi:DNA-binding NarL/FixJ family response regulator